MVMKFASSITQTALSVGMVPGMRLEGGEEAGLGTEEGEEEEGGGGGGFGEEKEEEEGVKRREEQEEEVVSCEAKMLVALGISVPSA